VDHSTISGDIAGTSGGGLAELLGSPVTIEFSQLVNDAATSGGGGIFLETAGTPSWTIEYSTVAFDHATGASADGGGIQTVSLVPGGGTLEVLNSTIAGNTATGNGGGIAIDDGATSTLAADFLFATLAGNTATGSGGGIFNSQTGTAVQLGNTIVADNSAGTGPDLSGLFADKVLNTPTAGDIIGHNIIGTTTGFTGLTNGTNGDQLGVNPMLNPLADNGGPTPTQSLQAGSPAVDAGKLDADVQAITTTDQRGVTRPDGGTDNPDVGAFESNLG
jgi:parallel beta-helix repeat protein